MTERETRILTTRLIPQPVKAEFMDGEQYLLKDGCKVVLELAVPVDGVEDLVNGSFRQFWNIAPAVEINAGNSTDPQSADAYELDITADTLTIKAGAYNAVFNALKTLRQHAEPLRGTREVAGYSLVQCRIQDKPAVGFRGIHFCIFPETPLWDLEKHIRLAAYHKFNYVVIEPWGNFPFQSHPEYGWAEEKLDRAELKRLIHLCKAAGITPVPQLNLLGHASAARAINGKHATLDFHPSLQPLFEPDGWSWCLSNPETRKMLTEMVIELYDFFEAPPFFHIGCDEADNLATCAACRKANIHDMVYDHIMHFYNLLKERNCRTIMWHDMMVNCDDTRWRGYTACGKSDEGLDSLVDELPKDLVIADWQYGWEDDPNDPKWPTVRYFKGKGREVMVCPWNSEPGMMSLGKIAADEKLFGYLETTWHIYHNMTYRLALGVSACAAWNPASFWCQWATLGWHLRQMGWDMGISEYEKTGWSRHQVDSGNYPAQLI